MTYIHDVVIAEGRIKVDNLFLLRVDTYSKVNTLLVLTLLCT